MDHKSGTVCRPISDMWAIIRPVQAVTERQLYSDSEATVQCELFWTAPTRNIFTYLLKSDILEIMWTHFSTVVVEWRITIFTLGKSRLLRVLCIRCGCSSLAGNSVWYEALVSLSVRAELCDNECPVTKGDIEVDIIIIIIICHWML